MSLETLPQQNTTVETLNKMEITAVNYTSLMMAMGTEKFKAFQNGDGLKSIPKLQEELSEHGFTNATYSIGTYKNSSGGEEVSLFVEQNYAESRIIFEIEPKSEKQLMFTQYAVKHLYIVGKDGVTADLTEELGSEGRIVVCPDKSYFANHMHPTTKTIHLMDLNKLDVGYSNFGLPIILHEIGHLKHMEADSSIDYTDHRKKIIQSLIFLGVTRVSLDKMVKQKDVALLKPVLKLFEDYGPTILNTEEIASLWATRWIEQKRAEGADFWNLEYEPYWEQLDVAMDTYITALALCNEVA